MKEQIILEFIGGCWDGMNLATESPDPVETRLARSVYASTDNGSKGRKARMPAGYAAGKRAVCGHEYEVTDRTEIDDEVLVRLQCCAGQDADQCLFLDDEVPVGKRIVFTFNGGHLDGETLESRSSDLDEAWLAIAYYCVMSLGMSVEAPWAAAASRHHRIEAAGIGKDHEYHIVERIEDDENVFIRCKWSAALKPAANRRGGGSFYPRPVARLP